jgi:hypothetical protein
VVAQQGVVVVVDPESVETAYPAIPAATTTATTARIAIGRIQAHRIEPFL